MQSLGLISAFPRVRISDLLSERHSSLSEYSGLYSSGRAAIYWALRRIGIGPGTVVWMPAFHCGVEVDAAIAAGAEVQFYRITEQLSADVEDLKKCLASRPGPVLAIHYFGFAQSTITELASICADAGVSLIEDCAHSLFSCQGMAPLGTFGAVGVFSFPKSLPVVEGGALRVNSEKLRGRARDEQLRSSFMPYKIHSKQLLRCLLPQRFLTWYDAQRKRSNGGQYQFAHSVLPLDYYDRPSSLTLRIVAALSDSDTAHARRSNWNTLNSLLMQEEGYSPVFQNLPEGICPLFLPIRVASRVEMEASLIKRKVDTFVFGRLPHRLLPAALRAECRSLRDDILGLPIHQQLAPSDIERVAEEVIRLLPTHSLNRSIQSVITMMR